MCSYSNKIYLIDISIKFSYLQHYALCNFLSSDVSEVKENQFSYHLANYSPSKKIKIKAVLTKISVLENKQKIFKHSCTRRFIGAWKSHLHRRRHVFDYRIGHTLLTNSIH